jgi:hypothetical protein
VDAERQRLEARQRELVAERKRAELAWLDELALTDDEALAERALRQLGFRAAQGRVVDGAVVTLHGRDLARLVRARADAGWSYADVRPLIHGDRDVPERYEPLGRVVAHRGELPEIVLDATVEPGTTIAFEVGDSYREWIVEDAVGYVGTPPPPVGARVWRAAGTS